MGKKRNFSVFDAIQELDSQDAKAESSRRKRSTHDAKRAQAAQSQSKIYNHLIECRILLQRSLVNSSSKSSKEEESSSSSFTDQCDQLIEQLLQARHQMIHHSNDEKEYDQEDDSLNDTLQSEYDECRNQWKEVLNRRHKDLRLHSGLTAKSQFKVMDSSFWEQVQATVEYEDMRNSGNINNNSESSDSEEDALFDDSKVYQQLLKDFVASSTGADGTGASKRLAKYNKKSSSKKKDVDRRASKGRKIRYTEIPKLANFTFPLSRPAISSLDQDEWFRSLFGGVGKLSK